MANFDMPFFFPTLFSLFSVFLQVRHAVTITSADAFSGWFDVEN